MPVDEIRVKDADGNTQTVRTFAADPATGGAQTQSNLLLDQIAEQTYASPEIVLLNAEGATGSPETVQKGNYLWAVWGTFGGCTAKLQWTPDSGTTWIDVSSTDTAALFNTALLDGSARVAIVGGAGVSLSSKIGGVF